MQSYLQWCNTARPYDRKNQVQLGKMMTMLYVPTRPRAAHPVHEIENIDIDPVQKRGNWLDEHGTVKKDHAAGYLVNDLEMARDRFAKIFGIACQQADKPYWDADEQGDGQGEGRHKNAGNGAASP